MSTTATNATHTAAPLHEEGHASDEDIWVQKHGRPCPVPTCGLTHGHTVECPRGLPHDDEAREARLEETALERLTEENAALRRAVDSAMRLLEQRREYRLIEAYRLVDDAYNELAEVQWLTDRNGRRILRGDELQCGEIDDQWRPCVRHLPRTGEVVVQLEWDAVPGLETRPSSTERHDYAMKAKSCLSRPPAAGRGTP